MKKNLLNLAIIASLMAPISASAAPPAFVTNGYDEGPGSLREALDSGAKKIVIKPSVSEIVLATPLEYSSTEPLTIIGSGQVITWDDTVTSDPVEGLLYGQSTLEVDALFYVSQGADLSLSRLHFEGLGDYSIFNQGGGKGIFVEVPSDAQGQVNVKLTDVSVRDTGNHGVHIRDCEDDDCGAGQGGEGTGSQASIFVSLKKVEIDGVGFGKQDADGVRVDDRNDGDIYLTATNSTFKNVGADGIELDEGDAGSVIINVRNAVFEKNGDYCSYVDTPDFNLDPNCNDEGDPDVDDAFDIDEAGTGGISGIISNVDVVDNLDEGLDFDSEGKGDDNFIDLDLVNIFAAGNADEAIKISEEIPDDADNAGASVMVRMRAIEVEGDVEVEEEGDGDLEVTLNGSTIGDDLKLSESDDGVGTVKLRGTTVGDELDFNNVDEI